VDRKSEYLGRGEGAGDGRLTFLPKEPLLSKPEIRRMA
jgi:hypothetical protein